MDMELAKSVEIAGDVHLVIEAVREALLKEDFGIISYVNVSEKILERTGNVMPAYIILGACNPNLSFRAIQSDNRIGLLLPCNVVVTQKTNESCLVIFNNPIAIMNVEPFLENEIIQETAHLAYKSLMQAYASLCALAGK